MQDIKQASLPSLLLNEIKISFLQVNLSSANQLNSVLASNHTLLDFYPRAFMLIAHPGLKLGYNST